VVTQARLIDGKAIAAALTQQIAGAVAELQARHGVTPGLATVLVGDDPASRIYIRNKTKACAAVGIASLEFTLAGDTGMREIVALIERLNADERVDGILVQLPLPGGIDDRQVIAALDPAKDVDGFHPLNVGRLWSGEPSLVPCTPQGCMLLLRSVVAQTAGVTAALIGRSVVVGRPLAALLITADCTVSVVHSKTRDPAAITRQADVLIAAIGRPQAVTADWIKPGATVIDVGINRIVGRDGTPRLVGDVDFDAAREIAGAITPVPGGVGPMTIASLLRNTLLAACRRRSLPEPLPPV
jgi:methylenetetrahydrofolate dehydrogenase (NADP+)/methenyltetrahydrofolate cyclohydrolase